MKTKTMKPYERELKLEDATVYAIERDHKLCCGHIVRGVPGKIPYHRAFGLYCDKCEAWVAILPSSFLQLKADALRFTLLSK